ncbi:MAG: alpha/beta hydrolase-fold protein [Planctomycetota bacterium]
MTSRSITLLGPQRRQQNVASAVDALRANGVDIGDDRPVAVISAGWEERDLELEALEEHLGRPTVPLGLYHRTEALFAESPELLDGLWHAKSVLDRLQEAYRIQLAGALDAARTLGGMDDVANPDLAEYQTDAIDVVRQIDERHFRRLSETQAELVADQEYDRHPGLARQRDEVLERIDGCSAALIAGGNTLILLNRLRMFGLADVLAERPVIAWSAGAMAISERVVFFHHTPPQGQNNTELAAVGLGLVKNVIPFPHAADRLDVADPPRIALIARRFAPAVCLTLDDGDRVVIDGGELSGEGSQQLTTEGTLRGVDVLALDGKAPDAGEAITPEVAVAEDGEPFVERDETGAQLAIRRFEAKGDFSPAAIDAFLGAHEFPLAEGSQVTFAYRGEADGVTLQHFIYGIPSSQEFHRVGDTDLWSLVVDMPPQSRVEYKLGVQLGEQGRWIRDPLNPKTARDPFGANSVCTSAGYEVPDWTEIDPEAPQGRLETWTLPSAALGDERTVTVYLPARFRPSRRYPLLVVHDGPDFLNYASLGVVLDNLIHRLEIAPMIVALSHPVARNQEYAAHRPHGQFIAEELVPAMEERYPLIGTPESRCLMGASFGAVASLSTAWYYPGLFQRLLLLSGSFAFTDIGTHERSAAFDPVVEFVNAFRERPGIPAEKVYAACGVYESLIYENRSMVPFLQASGLEVRYDEARDGHNWENWRDRMRDGLSWLFPGPLWMVYE